MTNYSIITIVSDQDLAKYQEKREKALSEIGEENVIVYQEGLSAVPAQGPGGQMAIVFMPFSMIEFKCTEEQHKAWKFSNTLIK